MESEPPPEPVEPGWLTYRLPAQLGCAGFVLSFALASAYYHMVIRGHLQDTAALFVGLPTFLSLVLIFTPRARSVTVTILKGITLALLLALILAYEGFICILMVAPLFYLVGVTIGLLVDFARKRKSDSLLSLAPLLPFLLLSLEGTHPRLSFPRTERVTVSRTLDESAGVLRAVWITSGFFGTHRIRSCRPGFRSRSVASESRVVPAPGAALR